jgi:hypothetical protein
VCNHSGENGDALLLTAPLSNRNPIQVHACPPLAPCRARQAAMVPLCRNAQAAVCAAMLLIAALSITMPPAARAQQQASSTSTGMATAATPLGGAATPACPLTEADFAEADYTQSKAACSKPPPRAGGATEPCALHER